MYNTRECNKILWEQKPCCILSRMGCLAKWARCAKNISIIFAPKFARAIDICTATRANWHITSFFLIRDNNQSQTAYNKKPPRWAVEFGFYVSHPKPWRRVMKLDLFWRRPTLPWLKPKYHRRYGVSLSGSGWNRGWLPLNNHQNKSSEHHNS